MYERTECSVLKNGRAIYVGVQSRNNIDAMKRECSVIEIKYRRSQAHLTYRNNQIDKFCFVSEIVHSHELNGVLCIAIRCFSHIVCVSRYGLETLSKKYLGTKNPDEKYRC